MNLMAKPAWLGRFSRAKLLFLLPAAFMAAFSWPQDGGKIPIFRGALNYEPAAEPTSLKIVVRLYESEPV
jgi:hypothetical protein